MNNERALQQDFEKAAYYAIMRGHHSIVRILLLEPSDPRGHLLLSSKSLGQGKQETVLMWAVIAGQESLIQEFLVHPTMLLNGVGNDLLNARDSAGETVLHKAAKTGRLAIARLLLNVNTAISPIYALDIEIKNHAGKTAIDMAKTKEIRALLMSAMKQVRLSIDEIMSVFC
jgi:ankyrin repeat protein